jgi:hypothetical protein
MDCPEIVILWILSWIFFITLMYYVLKWATQNFFQKPLNPNEKKIQDFILSFYTLGMLVILEFCGLIYPIVNAMNLNSFKYEHLLNFNTTLNFIFAPKESTMLCGNEICSISSSSSFSIENFTVLLSLISGLIILTYFLGYIENSQNLLSDQQGEGRKYFWFYLMITLLSLVLMLLELNSSIPNIINRGEVSLDLYSLGLSLLALLNIIMIINFAIRYNSIIQDFELLKTQTGLLDEIASQSDEKPMISHLINKIDTLILGVNFFSGFIFVTIVLTAFYAYTIRSVNIFSIIFFECTLVFLHIAITRVYLMPRRLFKIELNNNSSIKDAFILFENSDYYQILCPKNHRRKIMKQAIIQLIGMEKTNVD